MTIKNKEFKKKVLDIVRDKEIWSEATTLPGILFGVVTTILTFFELNSIYKIKLFIVLLIFCVGFVIYFFLKAMLKKEITLSIDGSEIIIKPGDIFSFSKDVFKTIAFNEYFDTEVDNGIISKKTLNGKYLKKYHDDTTYLDENIEKDSRLKEEILETNVSRPLGGKKTRYSLGTVYKDEDFFLVAFSKFDEKNRANLELREYASCLIKFWNEINSLYGQYEVVVPLLGSGITRKKDFTATDQQLLEVMLWTFQISKVKFEEPSKVTIVLYGDSYKKINFYKLKEFEKNGI